MNLEEMKTCSQRIKALREERNMSLRQFAELLDVKKSTLYDWENGHVESMKTSSIKKIADMCLVSPLWVMGYDVPKERETEEHEGLRKKIEDEMLSMSMEDLINLEKFIHTFINKE